MERIYQYDNVGNLIQTQDKRFGTTNYRYDKLGQIQLAGQELFHFDPAHNIIERESERIQNNRMTEYQGIRYQYDEFGNLSQRTLPNGEVQYYAYNAKDQLIEATIQKPNQLTETWQYQYDVLGRRISKRLKNGENLQETCFVWDGSHLIREENESNAYSYIYTHPSSYEPLAQLHFAKNSKNPTACYYYHNDQIGVPRELTDEQGKLCWYGDYSGWGKLKSHYDLTKQKSIHQPFRLQNQYSDEETGLHYNFFRYYEPNVGRFTQLDPIGLAGGENLYRFADNVQGWGDFLGLEGYNLLQKLDKQLKGIYVDASATAGYGLAVSAEYAGDGKIICSLAITNGASLDISGGMSHSFDIKEMKNGRLIDGKKEDGFFEESCGTIKAGASVSSCVGSNLSQGANPYTVIKGGIGAGGGITQSIGYQKTIDLKEILRVDPSIPYPGYGW